MLTGFQNNFTSRLTSEIPVFKDHCGLSGANFCARCSCSKQLLNRYCPSYMSITNSLTKKIFTLSVPGNPLNNNNNNNNNSNDLNL